MPALCKRRVLAVGGSKAVAMPPNWLCALGLDLGDTVELLYDSVVLIKPQDMRVDPELLVKELALLSPTRPGSRSGVPT
jgi:antitoxin component of MazEF toxin-antitoxin module